MFLRREARVERGREHRGGDAFLDRRDRRPAALARVGDAAGELVERRGVVERRGGEVEEPRADDAAAAPDLGHLGRVDVELVELGPLERRRLGVHVALPLAHVRVRDDVQPFGIRRHEAVLDAVVDHLHEVPCAVRAAVVVPVLGLARVAGATGCARRRVEAGRDRGEDGGEAVDDLVLAADHQAEAALESPHAAARPDVDVVDALLAERVGVPDVVDVVRVAAVDDRVAGLEHLRERRDRLVGDVARGDHHPGRARLLELARRSPRATRSRPRRRPRAPSPRRRRRRSRRSGGRRA